MTAHMFPPRVQLKGCRHAGSIGAIGWPSGTAV